MIGWYELNNIFTSFNVYKLSYLNNTAIIMMIVFNDIP